jgi:hypothetical protein
LWPASRLTGAFFFLRQCTKAEIDRILRESITDPVGPEFMAPPSRSTA